MRSKSTFARELIKKRKHVPRVKTVWYKYKDFILVGIRNSKELYFSLDFLAPICPSNMIYSTCTCEKTCEAPTICQSNCQVPKRCFCPDGFFLKGSDCVRPEDCECYLQSSAKVVPVGIDILGNNHCFSYHVTYDMQEYELKRSLF